MVGRECRCRCVRSEPRRAGVNRALTAQASGALAEKAQRLRASLVRQSKGAHSKQKLAGALEQLASSVAQGTEEVRSWFGEAAGEGVGPDERRRAANEIVAITSERGSQGGERHARARSRESGTMSQRPASVVPPSGPAENCTLTLFRKVGLRLMGVRLVSRAFLNPIAKTVKLLRNGEEDSVMYFYQALAVPRE